MMTSALMMSLKIWHSALLHPSKPTMFTNYQPFYLVGVTICI